MDEELIAGRYRKVRAIGRGGMGTVWLCKDEILQRDVAIKQIGALAGEDGDGTARAMREARLAASLNHPNAVSIYDVIEQGGKPWLVMEYVDAQNLAQIIKKRGRLQPLEIASIAAQIAKALSAAHKAGIVHRDVKPSNILVDEFGVAKITDFGIAKAHTDPQLTRTGMMAGTPAYFAPELARGRTPSAPSDVWALGATIFHATEGAPPFGMDENTLAMLYRIGVEEPAVARHAGVLTAPLAHLLDTDLNSRWTMAMAAAKLSDISEPGRNVSMGDAAAATRLERTPQTGPVGAPPTGANPLTDHQLRTPYPAAAYPATGPYSAPGTGTTRPASGAQLPYGPATHPPEPKKSRKPLIVAIVTLAVIALIAGTVLIVNGLRKPDSVDAATTSSQSSATDGSTADEPSDQDSPPGGQFTDDPASTTPSTSASPDATSQAMTDFIVDYYGLLPHNPGAAWDFLADTMQVNGYAGYEEFWSTVSYVKPSELVADPSALFVDATMTYQFTDGTSKIERTRFFLSKTDGSFLIEHVQII